MAQLGEDIIGTSALAPFFKVANADEVGIIARKAALVMRIALGYVPSVASRKKPWCALPRPATHGVLSAMRGLI